MSVLKVTGVTDLAGLGGFTLSSGSITCNGTLRVTNININGTITGSSNYNIPSFSGQSGQFLSTNGTNLIWSSEISGGGSGGAGFRSMQVWTSNGTWYRPSDVKSIRVQVVGAGGGGSGKCESGGAGGFSERVIDVSNVSSVSVSVGNPGGGTSYAGCGGNGNGSSFGGYCSNWSKYGNYTSGASYMGGSQPASHQQENYSHRHQSHCAWGAGGNGAREGNRGARGREGVVVVYEYYG